MTLTADQYFQISQGYAQAAADPYVSPERRAAFASKAEWFDFLGRRQGGTFRSEGNASRGKSDLAALPLAGELSYSERLRRSRRPLVMTLCLTGAALYLIGTLSSTNALNLFGGSDRQEVASQLTLSLVPLQRGASVEGKTTEQGGRQFQPTADRPQPIPLDQPSSETPALTGPLELSSPSPPPERIEELAAAPAEVLKVTASAIIRNGPSTSAKKIGTATRGTELRVKAREGDWVQFVYSSSDTKGWIHSSLVGTTLGNGTTSSAVTPVDASATTPPKPKKVAKKRIKQKSSAPIQASKQRPSRPGLPALGPRAYADLPDDEKFLPSRRYRPGLVTKRRVLRERD